MNRFKFALCASVMLLLVPAMLLALPVLPSAGRYAILKRDILIAVAAVTTAACGVAYFKSRATIPLILGGTSALMLCNLLWNYCFSKYVKHHDYHREVFRKTMHNLWAPMYGRFEWSNWNWAAAASAIAAIWFAWVWFRPLDKRFTWRSWLILFTLQLGLILTFALTETPVRLSSNIAGYNEFRQDIHSFHGPRDTLRNYVQRMPELEWYGQHYPPGNLILLEIEKAMRWTGLTEAIVIACTILSALPLYWLARELELEPMAANIGVLLFMGTTGVLVYCTINTTSLLLLPTTLALWSLVRALKTGSVAAAILLGVVFTGYMMFSFSASILSVMIALTTLIGWSGGVFQTKNVIRAAAFAAAAMMISMLFLYLVTGFSIPACFIAAVHGHHEQQGNGGFDDARRYLFRSTGNLLAYVVSIVPLSILAAAAILSRRMDGLARALFLASGVTVVIAAFSGLFYVETERIWIFMNPALALAAGYELARRSKTENAYVTYLVFALVLFISCTQEFFFQHYR